MNMTMADVRKPAYPRNKQIRIARDVRQSAVDPLGSNLPTAEILIDFGSSANIYK